jgi:hypothetical protein
MDVRSEIRRAGRLRGELLFGGRLGARVELGRSILRGRRSVLARAGPLSTLRRESLSLFKVRIDRFASSL